MKKVFFLIVMFYFALSCKGQQNQSSIDFMNLMNFQDVSIKDCPLNPNRDTVISYIYKELNSSKENGSGCFFAIPKKESLLWKMDYRATMKRSEISKSIQDKKTIAKKMLVDEDTTLIKNFELYFFYVKPIDIIENGSSISDDGQIVLDYTVKDNSTVFIYLHENDVWIENGKENIGEDVPRTYGMSVMEKILKERFGR